MGAAASGSVWAHQGAQGSALCTPLGKGSRRPTLHPTATGSSHQPAQPLRAAPRPELSLVG